jgi:hypothetical protein
MEPEVSLPCPHELAKRCFYNAKIISRPYMISVGQLLLRNCTSA